MNSNPFALAESGVVPDVLLRAGIRRLLRSRIADEDPGELELRQENLERWLAQMRRGPIALSVEKANQQHYEVPTSFFETVLGPRLKYSSALWPSVSTTLAQAEEAMLDLTFRRAELEDGHEILELGCGWGSLTLFMAERLPRARVTAVSNSNSQREFIERRAAALGLGNVRVVTADMNGFAPQGDFDRVVSVEMFEHMRNWEELLARIARWLRPEGRLFLHVFCHRELAYPFEASDDDDWMARHFFTGGMMPSDSTLPRLQRDLLLDAHWRVNGRHYARTASAWIARLESARPQLLELLGSVYGASQRQRWWMRWKLFFMACEELFGFRRGEEWFVSHYRMRPRGTAGSSP